MLRRAFGVALVLGACALSVGACLMHEPGSSLGTFAVTGTLKTQTCGAGVTADNPWTFKLRLSRSANLLYWLQDSAPAISGTIDGQGNALVTSSSIYDLQAADGGTPYCGVVRDDKFTAALGNGPAAVSSFNGTLAYHYDVVQGADCTGLLPAAGFSTMPCDVAYEIAATRTSP